MRGNRGPTRRRGLSPSGGWWPARRVCRGLWPGSRLSDRFGYRRPSRPARRPTSRCRRRSIPAAPARPPGACRTPRTIHPTSRTRAGWLSRRNPCMELHLRRPWPPRSPACLRHRSAAERRQRGRGRQRTRRTPSGSHFDGWRFRGGGPQRGTSPLPGSCSRHVRAVPTPRDAVGAPGGISAFRDHMSASSRH